MSTGPGESVASGGSFDPDATMRPDLLVVDPSIVGLGEHLAVTYPGGRERGVA